MVLGCFRVNFSILFQKLYFSPQIYPIGTPAFLIYILFYSNGIYLINKSIHLRFHAYDLREISFFSTPTPCFTISNTGIITPSGVLYCNWLAKIYDLHLYYINWLSKHLIIGWKFEFSLSKFTNRLKFDWKISKWH